MQANATAADIATAWGTFEMPNANAKVTADKYVKVASAVTIGTETTEMGNIRIAGTVTDFGANAVTVGTDKFVKTGDKVQGYSCGYYSYSN